jgi:YegS/Rv2252/BmrU family lipid kinase
MEHQGHLVVANAEAGSAEGLDEALAVLSRAEVVRTNAPEELDAVLRQTGGRIVVVAGGDGSLHAVLAALHRLDALASSAIGVVPLGTGNDFARGAGIPLEPAAAARLVLSGRPAPVDLILDDTGGVVVNGVHVGAGAEASRAARPWKRLLGPVGYVVGAAVTAVNPPTLRLRVTVDGEVISDRPTLQVAIGNAPYVGGGTELTPEADPADGRADVMVSCAVAPLARAAYALHLRRGEHHHRDDVTYARGHTVTVAGEAFHASADGEIQGPLSSRTWRVRPAAFSVILPPHA